MSNRKRRSENRRQELLRLRESLQRLVPTRVADFLCPICLEEFSFSDPKGATEAHIIPKAANGKMTTFVCHACNSNAGASIDKWYGEHLRLKEAGLSIFDTNHVSGRVTVNGLEFGGRIKKNASCGLDVLLFTNGSNPRHFDELRNGRGPVAIQSVESAFPLLGKRREVHLGALQAAYLWLFKAFGYTPVFQSSLDIVRLQLQRPREAIIPAYFVAAAKKPIPRAIGAAEVSDLRCIFVSAGGLVVFLPRLGDNDFYNKLPKDFATATIRLEEFWGKPIPAGISYGLSVAGELWLWPDKLETAPESTGLIYVEQIGSEALLMLPTTKERIENAEKDGVQVIRVKVN